PIAAERDAVTRLVGQRAAKQRARRKAHVRCARLGEGVAGAVVLDDLEAVGLHVAGVEELRGALLFGEIGDDLDRRGLREYRLFPDRIVERRTRIAFLLVADPLG